MWFARWVNRERCSVIISNDPSGEWTVEIGDGFTGERSRSLGQAMYSAAYHCERDPDWQWTTDYLKSL